MTFKITKSKIKTVDYHGLILNVELDDEYIATDLNGSVYAYWGGLTGPWNLGASWTNGVSGSSRYITNIEFEGDWKESLMAVNNGD